jgi:hypothetical protein
VLLGFAIIPFCAGVITLATVFLFGASVKTRANVAKKTKVDAEKKKIKRELMHRTLLHDLRAGGSYGG